MSSSVSPRHSRTVFLSIVLLVLAEHATSSVYSAAAFSGPISIGSLTFYNTVFGSPTLISEGTYDIHLSTTSKP